MSGRVHIDTIMAFLRYNVDDAKSFRSTSSSYYPGFSRIITEALLKFSPHCPSSGVGSAAFCHSSRISYIIYVYYYTFINQIGLNIQLKSDRKHTSTDNLFVALLA
jgi:hypothetical protein